MSDQLMTATGTRAFPLDGDDRTTLIHGEWRRGRGGDPVEVRDPSNNRTFLSVVPASPDDVNEAVASSWRAFYESWGRSPGMDRGDTIRRLAQLMRDHVEDLAELEARNTGIPLKQSRFEVVSAARHFDFFAGLAGKIEGISADLPDGRLMYGLREPWGVVAQIVPWNTPLKLLARGCAAALACGNTVVVKPSIVAGASVLLWGKLAQEAGFPAGVINIVPGSGRSTGSTLVNHPDVRKIVFTGGGVGGEEVLADAGRQVTPVLAELGGKGPIIVCEDADLDEAAAGIVSQAFARQGQVCFAGTRLLVPASIHDELVAKVAERANRLTVGPAMDESSQLGPLISPEHRADVVAYLDEAVAEGCTIVEGGGVPDDPALAEGNFLRPTLVTGVVQSQRIATDEIFGPVLTVQVYEDLEQAIVDSNATDFGLASYIWTRDIRRALHLARRLECGNVFINTYRYASEVPFGGWKGSGMGREHGLEALREYMQLKTVVVGMDPWVDPVLS